MKMPVFPMLSQTHVLHTPFILSSSPSQYSTDFRNILPFHSLLLSPT